MRGGRSWGLLAIGLSCAAALLYGMVYAGAPWIDAAHDLVLSLTGDAVYVGAIGAAGAACVLRGLLVRAERWAWLAIGLGLLGWAAGEVLWIIAARGPGISYPSAADVLFLLSYPLSFVGIALLVHRRVRVSGVGQLLDGAIAALAATAVGAAALAPALIDLTDAPAEQIAVNLAYPLGDLLLLGFVVLACSLMAWRPGRVLTLLALGFGLQALADGIYLYQEAVGAYAEQGLAAVDVLWPLSVVPIAIAAWVDPSPPPIRREPAGTSVSVPAIGASAAIAVIAFGQLQDRVGGMRPELGPAMDIAAATMVLVVARLLFTLRENHRLLRRSRREADTDALTGLHNRRRLMGDLGVALHGAAGPERILVIYDLDGFKVYNDSFGHGAGDLLLTRLGRRLGEAAERRGGTAYRLGGDEFCVLATLESAGVHDIVEAGATALTEAGDVFSISASKGWAVVPTEANETGEALRLADRRMYADKDRRIESAERQARDLLLTVLRERAPDLGRHLQGTGLLASEMARELGLDGEQREIVVRAAELHDVGKMAIPDAILRKPGPLDEVEWNLVRQHTLIGERILAAAPALAGVATVVRSSHERWDGEGYPDGIAGQAIPLASRICLICDAYDAMVSGRAYGPRCTPAEAAEELRRNAGSQFDPDLVELFCARIVPGLTRANDLEPLATGDDRGG